MELMVKQGYKQTEVGLIPEDWNIKPLSELLFESPKYGIGASAINFDYNSYTYLRITDIDENGRLIEEGLKSVNHSEASNYIIKEGELVFARTGASVGKSYLHNPKNGVLVYAGFLIKVNPNYNLLDSSYLRNQVNTSSYWNWITVNSMRSGQPGINSNELGTFLVPLPPTLAEQKSIARALNDVDELITKLDKLTAKKKAVKQGAMQSLLTPPHKGGKRLEGFTCEWKLNTLGEIASFYSGGTPLTSVSDYYKGNIPWISSSELNKIRINFTDKFISKAGLENSSAKLVKKDTLLLAMYGATAGVCALTNIEGAINQAVLAIITHECNTEFLFQYFRHNKEFIIKTYTQGGQPNLSGGIVKSIEAWLPRTIEEQNAIAQILSDIDAEIEQLEAKKVKYQSIKQGMMQELLTGKTRLV